MMMMMMMTTVKLCNKTCKHAHGHIITSSDGWFLMELWAFHDILIPENHPSSWTTKRNSVGDLFGTEARKCVEHSLGMSGAWLCSWLHGLPRITFWWCNSLLLNMAHLQLIYLVKMMIYHSYVRLWEGKWSNMIQQSSLSLRHCLPPSPHLPQIWKQISHIWLSMGMSSGKSH